MCRKWWEFRDHARCKAVSYAIRDRVKIPALIVNLEASSAGFARKRALRVLDRLAEASNGHYWPVATLMR